MQSIQRIKDSSLFYHKNHYLELLSFTSFTDVKEGIEETKYFINKEYTNEKNNGTLTDESEKHYLFKLNDLVKMEDYFINIYK